MPLFSDQYRNSWSVVNLEIGVKLELEYITADMIYEELKEIIYKQK